LRCVVEVEAFRLPFTFTFWERGASELLDALDIGETGLSGGPEDCLKPAFDLGGVCGSDATSAGVVGTVALWLDAPPFFFGVDFGASGSRLALEWNLGSVLYSTGRGRLCLCQYLPIKGVSYRTGGYNHTLTTSATLRLISQGALPPSNSNTLWTATV
jgi:hypothetical protein